MLAHLLPQGRRGGFKVYGFDFALLGPRNYESNRSSFVAVQLLGFSGFFCRLIAPSITVVYNTGAPDKLTHRFNRARHISVQFCFGFETRFFANKHRFFLFSFTFRLTFAFCCINRHRISDIRVSFSDIFASAQNTESESFSVYYTCVSLL